MMGRFFNRYTVLAIGAQIIAIIETWIMALAISPFGDRLFSLMFYCYFPFGYFVIEILKLPAKGEFGGVLESLTLGVLVYAFIFGFVMSYWTRRNSQAR